MSGTRQRAAFYARRGSPAWDWWTVLHPPYTLWHLSYVVIGACLAPQVRTSTLLATLLAFFLAVGIAAHVLDEWNGRPLGTRIPSGLLISAAVIGLVGALALGGLGVERVGGWLVAFMVLGGGLVVAYDLELFGGVAHTDLGFALSWGAFPLLTAYFAQAGTLRLPALLAAGGAVALSAAQRRLSTPARLLRRRATAMEAVVTLRDGTVTDLGITGVLRPLESALSAMTWSIVALAAALAVARLG